jgi:hypothetical protein
VTVPSVKGNITVDLNKTANYYSISLSSPNNTTAIVGIPKKSFSVLKSIEINDKLIWNGSYMGKVTGIKWHSEDEQYVKFIAAPGQWKFIGIGTLPLSSPKPQVAEANKGMKLDKKKWMASASTKDSLFLFSGDHIPIEVPAENAIDGDYWTGWRDMTKTQYNTQWFSVDMHEEKTFNKIVLDNTWALWDSPNQFSVFLSDDGVKWSNPIATGKGELGITTISFPTQKARYIRVNQTGTDATYHWSIYEFDVYYKK